MGVAAHLQAMTDNDLTAPGPEVPAGHCTQHAVHDPACLSCHRAAVDLAVATGRPLPEFRDEDMQLRRDPDVDLAAMDAAVGRAVSRPVRDRSRSSLAQAWSAWLDLALDQTIDDGNGGEESLLGFVLATNPDLRTRLGAVLAGHAERPTVETEGHTCPSCGSAAHCRVDGAGRGHSAPVSPDSARLREAVARLRQDVASGPFQRIDGWVHAIPPDRLADLRAVLATMAKGVTEASLSVLAESDRTAGHPGECMACLSGDTNHICRPNTVVADSAGLREQVREAVYRNSSYLPGVQADERNVEQITDAVLAVVGRDRREVGRFLPDGRYTLVVEAGRARIDQLPAAAEGARA